MRIADVHMQAMNNLLYKAKEGVVEITYDGIDAEMNNLWTVSVDGLVIIEKGHYYHIVQTLAGEVITKGAK